MIPIDKFDLLCIISRMIEEQVALNIILGGITYMQLQPLKELLQDLEKEMILLGYTAGSMKYYRHRWKRSIEFANVKQNVRLLKILILT